MLFSALSIVVMWLALVTASCYEDGVKLFDLLGRLTEALNQPLNVSINQYSLKFVLLFLFAYTMGIGIYLTSRENRRPGEEHGSAKWGNASALARKYADRKHKFRNIILSQTLALSLNAKAHRRNLNVLIRMQTEIYLYFTVQAVRIMLWYQLHQALDLPYFADQIAIKNTEC